MTILLNQSNEFAQGEMAHPIKGGDYEVEDLDKAAGLDLSQPHGALAEGQCGLGNDDNK